MLAQLSFSTFNVFASLSSKGHNMFMKFVSPNTLRRVKRNLEFKSYWGPLATIQRVWKELDYHEVLQDVERWEDLFLWVHCEEQESQWYHRELDKCKCRVTMVTQWGIITIEPSEHSHNKDLARAKTVRFQMVTDSQ